MKPKIKPGPWSDEPNLVKWVDQDTGYECLILRVPDMGHLCGYVRVPQGHSYFAQDPDDVPVEVHGGLTFAGKPHFDDTAEGYWFGFDCAHYQDVVPLMASMSMPSNGGTYKNVEYVRAEVLSLAKQMKELENAAS